MKILILILIIAFFTNPNEAQHRETLKTKLNIIFQKNMEKEPSSNNEWSQMGQQIGLGLSTAFVNKIVENLVIVDNYLIFSITKISTKENTKIIGMGVFGNVIFSKKLEDALVDAQ